MNMLAQAAIFFGAAVIVVPFFKRLGLGSVLGYLAAGALIGPFGLALIKNVNASMDFAEFGVVLLLFVIGLELQPARLWTMRDRVFGLGSAQVALTGIALGLVATLFGIAGREAAVIGVSLALSSTAFVLQTLAERNELKDKHGRLAFAVLLFQDLAAIPLLAAVPLLGGGYADANLSAILLSVTKIVGVIGAVILVGNFGLRYGLRAVASTRIPELFTATTLLIVTGTALLMDSVGISMALGSFLAGVLLANSEYRHELEADIEPFKGLLLGLFFISVGMGLNLGLVRAEFKLLAGIVAAMLAVKAIIMFGLGRIWHLSTPSARKLALALPQGGEFAFVIFTAAVSAGIMTRAHAELLTLAVSMSMAATPLLTIISDWMTRGLVTPYEPAYRVDPNEDHAVIIAGFGRFGQITGRILAARHIPFIALDASAEQVDFVRKFGAEIFYGDASRLDLLRAARADKAKVFVLAIDEMEASVRTAEAVTKHFPHLKVFARARNRQHAYRLMDLGVTVLQRETFLSALELAKDVLLGLGMSAKEADRTVRTFRAHDEKRLFEHHTHYTDEGKMQSLAKASSKELEEMFARDAAEQAAGDTKSGTERKQRAA